MIHHLSAYDIEKLVKRFYAKVRADSLLGPIFNDVAHVNWDSHISLLCQFWRSIMLKTAEYHGNAYSKHAALADMTMIGPAHRQRWLDLFTTETNQCLPPDAAALIIERATLISMSLSTAMGLKLP